MKPDARAAGSPLPLVVQVGFAGSRHLMAPECKDGGDQVKFERRIEVWLSERLRRLRRELEMGERHFFCGVSSLAIGGDTIFSRACRANGIWHRVFMPQTRDEFLVAVGSSG